MVSFSCDTCNETLAKKKVATHRCDGGYTCIDCSVTFYGMDFKAHNTCISEAEKYQGALYVPPKGKGNKKAPQTTAPAPVQTPKKESKPVTEKKSSDSKSTTLSSIVPKNKQSSLYKIVKQLEKEGSNKQSKKDILKNLIVEQQSDGSITLKLK